MFYDIEGTVSELKLREFAMTPVMSHIVEWDTIEMYQDSLSGGCQHEKMRPVTSSILQDA